MVSALERFHCVDGSNNDGSTHVYFRHPSEHITMSELMMNDCHEFRFKLAVGCYNVFDYTKYDQRPDRNYLVTIFEPKTFMNCRILGFVE